MPLPPYSNYRAPSGGTVSMVGGTGPGPDVFGNRIGAIAMPNPSADLAKVYPNLSGTNAATSSALLSKLHGQLSPDTINMIQNQAAQWGAASGMPGFSPGSLNWNKSLRDIGRTSEDQIQQGLQDYSPVVGAVSNTQTVQPALQAEINATNATNAAAPNPTAAGTYAQDLFDKYLKQLSGPAGGTGSSGGGSSALPWYAQGRAGQSYTTPALAGGVRGNTTPGAAGNIYG